MKMVGMLKKVKVRGIDRDGCLASARRLPSVPIAKPDDGRNVTGGSDEPAW